MPGPADKASKTSQPDVRILIIDDDEATQNAMRHVLDSEGWKFKIQPLASETLNELAAEQWSLLLVNVALSGLSGPLFATLRDLSQATAVEEGKRRVRVLFLVPELLAQHAQGWLEHERLPYVIKPVNLHDFLDKVSDLLVENQSIERPIRQVRTDFRAERRAKDRRKSPDRRATPMFAARDDYSYSDEEIAEFESQEKEQSKRRYKPPTDLGVPKDRQ